jgi:hypothetical protein
MINRKVQGSGFRVQGSRFRVQGSGFKVQGSGFKVQSSAPPLAKKTAGLIKKETLKKRISNNECRMSKECILPVVSFCVERSIL